MFSLFMAKSPLSLRGFLSVCTFSTSASDDVGAKGDYRINLVSMQSP